MISAVAIVQTNFPKFPELFARMFARINLPIADTPPTVSRLRLNLGLGVF